MSCHLYLWPPNGTPFGSFWINFTGKVVFLFKVDTNKAILHITAQTAFPWLFQFLLAWKECVKSSTSWAMGPDIICAMSFFSSSVVEPPAILITWSIIASFGFGNSNFSFPWAGYILYSIKTKVLIAQFWRELWNDFWMSSL